MIPIYLAQEGLLLASLASLFCLIPIIYWVIAILLCIWVYRDAESRGMNGVLWLLVVLVAGLIGLIIYLVIRKEKPPTPPPPA